jgi:hypothetical protein
MIKAFFNSRTPTCTPSGAITLSSLDFIASLILSSGMLIPFHKKKRHEAVCFTLLLFTAGGTLFA